MESLLGSFDGHLIGRRLRQARTDFDESSHRARSRRRPIPVNFVGMLNKASWAALSRTKQRTSPQRGNAPTSQGAKRHSRVPEEVMLQSRGAAQLDLRLPFRELFDAPVNPAGEVLRSTA